jgi:hypothetical protein
MIMLLVYVMVEWVKGKCRKTERILERITEFVPDPLLSYDLATKNIPIEGKELLKFYDDEQLTNLYIPDYQSKPLICCLMESDQAVEFPLKSEFTLFFWGKVETYPATVPVTGQSTKILQIFSDSDSITKYTSNTKHNFN